MPTRATVSSTQSLPLRRLASTSAIHVTSPAGLSSLIAPVRHENDVFKPSHQANQDSVQRLLDSLADAEQQPRSKAENARRYGLPSLPWMLDKIEQGQILDPMSKFYSATAPRMHGAVQGNWVPLNQGLINNMLQALAKTALSHSGKWCDVEQETTLKRIWTPSQVRASVDVLQIPAQQLAVYGIASVYDIAGVMNILPSHASIASALRAIAAHTDLATFAQCLTLILLQLSGVPFHQAQLQASSRTLKHEDFDCRSIPANVIASLVDGFGILRKPVLGERFLQWWAISRRRLAGITSSTEHMVQIPGKATENALLPATAFLGEQNIWTSLVRARAVNADLLGSRHWLEEYRRLHRGVCVHSGPYLEHVRCCTMADAVDVSDVDERLLSIYGRRRRLRQSIMREALHMLAQDGVKIEGKLLSLLMNFEVGYGNLDEAAQMIQTAVCGNEIRHPIPAMYKVIFRLHKLYAIRNVGRGNPFDAVDPVGRSDTTAKLPYRDVRRTFCHYASRRYTFDEWNENARRTATEQALEASIVLGDLPMALAALELMRTYDTTPGLKTHNAALDWLSRCEDGHGGARQHASRQRQNISPSWLTTSGSFKQSSQLALQSAQQRLEALSLSAGRPVHEMMTVTQTTSYPTTNIDGQADRADVRGLDLSTHIRSMIVRTIRQAMPYDAAKRSTCAPWVQSVCATYERRTGMGDRGIVRECMRDLLRDAKGQIRVRRLSHLL